MNVPRALLALCAAAATLALGGCAGDMEAGAPPAAGRYGGAIEGSVAPEFAGLGPWLNGEPVTIAALAAEDRVVLVDFWTYTCVNCLRTLPFLADWHEKYAGRGLTIVGVHAPEFEFEKDPQNVARAVRDLGVAYPVAQDDDWLTWEAFANNVWPAKYLVGADGTIVYRHFGEGDYLETEGAIRAALTEAGHDVSDIALGGVATPELDPDVQGITRELYFGYERNYHPSGVYAAQDAYYEGPDLVLHYDDPGPPRSHNQWYAHGAWLNEREGLVHARATDDLGDYIAFRFAGRTVNPVLHPPPGGEPAEVVVLLDGAPLTPEQAGADVTFEDGRSLVRVDEPRMYRVVELPALGDHELRLASDAEGFAIYAVTFGAYLEGP